MERLTFAFFVLLTSLSANQAFADCKKMVVDLEEITRNQLQIDRSADQLLALSVQAKPFDQSTFDSAIFDLNNVKRKLSTLSEGIDSCRDFVNEDFKKTESDGQPHSQGFLKRNGIDKIKELKSSLNDSLKKLGQLTNISVKNERALFSLKESTLAEYALNQSKLERAHSQNESVYKTALSVYAKARKVEKAEFDAMKQLTDKAAAKYDGVPEAEEMNLKHLNSGKNCDVLFGDKSVGLNEKLLDSEKKLASLCQDNQKDPTAVIHFFRDCILNIGELSEYLVSVNGEFNKNISHLKDGGTSLNEVLNQYCTNPNYQVPSEFSTFLEGSNASSYGVNKKARDALATSQKRVKCILDHVDSVLADEDVLKVASSITFTKNDEFEKTYKAAKGLTGGFKKLLDEQFEKAISADPFPITPESVATYDRQFSACKKARNTGIPVLETTVKEDTAQIIRRQIADDREARKLSRSLKHEKPPCVPDYDENGPVPGTCPGDEKESVSTDSK